ncbi:RICIN domain-containing protein [uncultured Microbacterium sp.]|uniref:RICIN domain-containing protein n=1 Tax=uncultured Microbacterium sp. TaxID=191216 RepID=UPI0028EC36A4|nr:RICIN domain-containing protein [uncultured Microbacterium sp.]
MRTRVAADDGAAMMMTMLFILFVGGLMLVLLGVLLNQASPLKFTQSSTRSVYAAQAGIQSGLSVLRSNTRTVGTGATKVTYGDPSALPKSALSGTVDGVAGSALSYSVSFSYFKESPSGKSEDWLKNNAMKATSLSTTNQPTYARIESTGTDTSTGTPRSRKIAAVYAFNTTNVNIPGGQILKADGSRCLKADSASVGSTIASVLKASCTDDTRNLWVYDTDYKLKLASTIGAPTVLCITGRPWASTKVSENATLQPCAATNAAAPGNQLWSWDDAQSWAAQKQDTTSGRSGRWLSLSSDVLVEISTKPGGVFNPEPAVGPGGARYETHQVVNYREFGRCMDVTDTQIGKDWMIVYPCKQDPRPSGADILWNHKWYYTEPTAPLTTNTPEKIKVYVNNKTDAANTYCLTASDDLTTNTDVTFKACTNAMNTRQTFVRNNETNNTISSWTFQLDGDRTKCLAAVPQAGYAWSHIRLVTCDGSTAQKWNAPAVTTGSKLGDYQEIG